MIKSFLRVQEREWGRMLVQLRQRTHQVPEWEE